MKSNKLFSLIAVLVLQVAGSSCLQTSGGDPKKANTEAPPVSGLTNGSTLASQSGVNVMTFTVNGANCSAGSYTNKPCVTVTICNPGTTTCQTVTDLLLDTGSYGLRVFKSAISSLTLPQVTSRQGGALAECAKFGDGSSEWGPVRTADVVMGNEPAVTVPIQVLDSTFGTVPTYCGTPDADVAAAGFNGILGVGLFDEDCGAGCTGTHTSNRMYYSCTGGNTGSGTGTSTCVGGTTNTTAEQVRNPVALLPVDNNGVLISLPSISSSGATTVSGYMIFGVGTRSNNSPDGTTFYSADAYGQFATAFNGKTYDSFLDTGSNGLFFDQPSGLATCGTSSAWFCPLTVQNYSAVNYGANGASGSAGTVNFQVANASSLFNSGKKALNDLGGNGGNMFDFGLPFYFGRNVFLGIDGKSSSVGTGPYWAY